MTMTILPVLQNTLQQTWTKFKAAATEARRDDSGQAALVIITIVIVAAGIAISQLSVQNNRRALEVVQAQRVNFDKITNAIDVYAISDQAGTGTYLIPCPATFAGNGTAQGYDGGSDCTTVNRGIVPWVTLGLAEEDVIDVNGNYLTYIVHDTEVEACSGTSPNAVSLSNQAGPTVDANYAIVSHGSNGFGAFNSNSGTQVNGGGVGANEQDNCPTGGACAPTVNQYRTGPTNDTVGATYFDDIVRGVSFAESFTEECMVLNDTTPECPPTSDTCQDFTGGDDGVVGVLKADRTSIGTNNNAGNSTNLVSTEVFDPDGMATTGDETVAFTFINNDNFATRACRFLEPTLPLTGYTIRTYARVFFEEDTGSDQGLGNGIVFGFLGHKEAIGAVAGDAVFVDNSICGGTDSANGFAEGALGFTFDSDIERFGVELDTFDHRPDPGPPVTATDIYDPDFNHFAIVLGNVNHEDGDADAEGDGTGSGTGNGDDGPVCRSATTTDGDPTSFGTAPEDRGGVGTGTYGANKEVSSTTADEGCLYNELDANWLEKGHPSTEGTFAQGNDVRIEVHGEAGNDCGAGQVLISAWIYQASENCGSCSDLSEDFTDDLPHISRCISNNDLNATADDEDEDLRGIRFFVSQGFAASGAGIGGRTSIDQVVALADRVDGTTKAVASDTALTIDVTESEVRDYYYDSGIPGGDITFDQAFVRINQATGGAQTGLFDDNFDDGFDTGINVFSVHGSLYADLDQGLGIAGVGQSDVTVDTIDPSAGGDFADFDEYLDLNDRERIAIEYDRQYRRFTVNLRGFGAVNNGGYAGSETENVILRAFNGDTQVGSNLDVDVCAANAGSTATNAGMTISHDFGGLFDRVHIIPVPADAADDEARTRFLVSAMKACGAAIPCGFNPQGNDGDDNSGDEFNDGGNNHTEAECHQITPWTVNTTGLGTSGEVDPERAVLFTGAPDNNNYNTDRTWIDFNDYDTDEAGAGADANAMAVNVLSIAGNIRLHDNNVESAGGFGVQGAFGTTQRLDSNDAAAAGEEEEIRFRFNEDWSRAFIRINRFNDLGGGDLEQAVVSLYDDDALVESHTISPCAGADTNARWRKEVSITPSANFDEIRVSANDTTISATSSEIQVNAVKACDLASGADCGNVSFGDNSADGARLCTEAIP